MYQCSFFQSLNILLEDLSIILCPLTVTADTSFKEWVEEDNDLEQPLITVKLKAGETVSNSIKKTVVEGNVKEDANDEIYDYTKTTITERILSANVSEVDIEIVENSSDLIGIKPVKDSNKKDLYLTFLPYLYKYIFSLFYLSLISYT